MSRNRVIAAVSAAALLGAGGLGAAQSAQSATDTPSNTSSSRPAKRAISTTQLAGIAKTLGVTSAELKAAMDDARPTKGSKADERAGRAAALAKALGVQTSAVQEILDANRPATPAEGSRPSRGSRPDQSTLVAALASGLNLSEAQVKTALATVRADDRAAHEARHDAVTAAIATTLDLDAADVKAAFDANRSAGGTGRRRG